MRRAAPWLAAPALCLAAMAPVAAAAAAAEPGGAAAAAPAGDPRQAAAAQLEEALAFHVGTLAYLYGFPMVDLTQQMRRETQGPGALAPLNAFHRFDRLVTPETSGLLRAPNSDTLYLSGWFDLAAGPVVIRAPDTGGRYYTLAVTDFLSEIQHVGRRTTGTRARDFVLVGPGDAPELPPGLTPIRVPTRDAWVLGRVLVRGAADLGAAAAVLAGFHAVPLRDWLRGVRETPSAAAADPAAAASAAPSASSLESLEFFEVLNRWLRANPRRPEEAALLAQFDAVGFGPGAEFVAARAGEAKRRGLERAIVEARAMLRAASRRPLPDVRRGWIFPLALGRYGHDYLMRATVAFGGYANLPEETVYAALTADAQGRPLRGDRDYLLRFPAGARPPVGAFWSLSAYRTADFALMPNATGRYSVGDHVDGFRRSRDGSFTIRISRQPPRSRDGNWLPVGEGPYYLILRLYEPGATVLDGRYAPPPIEEAPVRPSSTRR